MKKLEQIRQESKEIKDKIDHTEERLRQLKNQEKKILKQDIINFDKIKINHTTIIQFILEQTGSYWDRPILPPIPQSGTFPSSKK